MSQRNKPNGKGNYDFHGWMCPCSDQNVAHLFPEWSEGDRRTAVCGQPMGGCANGRYDQPYCQACIDRAPAAEDKVLLKLVKQNRKAIIGLFKQIKKLAQSSHVIGFWRDEDER